MSLKNFHANGLLQKVIYCLSFLLMSIWACAQGQGALTGKVEDALNNESLNGVSISARNTKFAKASLPDGTYTLSLPSGIYTIRFSYTGYQTKEITGVSIKSGQTTYLNLLMQASTGQLAGVVVVANVKKETQASVYNIQKRSAAASDGISLEAIRRTPDNNAGQILKRVTGVNVQENRFIVVRGLNDQYNQTMLNGVVMTSTETNRNAFAFDLIPAAVIDNITVNKTATPDMPGNFAGGIVQVNTKDFPAKDFYSLTIGGGYSDKTLGKDFYSDKRSSLDVIGFGAKSRDLPDNFPSPNSRVPLLYMNIQEQSRYLKMLPNNLSPVNYGKSRPNENLQFGLGKTFELSSASQLGVVLAISQRKVELIEQETTAREPVFSTNLLPDTLGGLGYYSENQRYRYSVDFGGVLNLAYRFGNNKITFKNLYTRVFTNSFINRPTLFIDNDNFPTNGSSQLVGYSYVTEEKGIINSVLSGEHRTGQNSETRLDWNVNITSNSTNTPDTRNFLFSKDSTGKLYSNTDADFKASLVGFSRLWSKSKDFISGGAFNVTTPFIFKRGYLLKTGLLFQNRQRDVQGTVLPIAGLQGNIDEVFSASNYSPEGAHVINVLAASVSGSSNYRAGSSLLAAYESMENKIGSWLRVIWGLRMENYQQNINVYTPQFYNGFNDPEYSINQAAARTTFNLLPSVNTVFSPTKKMNIRLAYANTVIRPELKDIASFVRYDLQTFSLSQGNKYLKSASIRNYDLKVEWFPSSGEILSVAGFYKQLKDPIEYSRGVSGTDYEKFRTPVNAGDAIVKGIEAEIRKKLDFLPFFKWLEHLTFFGNASLLHSHVSSKVINNTYFSTLGAHPLTGQPDYIINSGVTLALFNNSFEITGSFNKTGDYVNELGSSDYTRHLADGSLVPQIPPFRVKSRNLVDLVITQSLLKEKLKIKFNVGNLLNEKFIVYQDLNANGKYDQPVVIDKTKSENNYQSGIDNAPFIITGQRTLMFSFSYTF